MCWFPQTFAQTSKRRATLLPHHTLHNWNKREGGPSKLIKASTLRFTLRILIYILLLTWLCGTFFFLGQGLGNTISDYLNKPPPTLQEIQQFRNCDAIFSTERPLYTDEEYQQLRVLWRSQGGTTIQYDSDDGRQSKVATPDFVPPFTSGQTTDGKGRGIFASRDIHAGEMTNGGVGNYIFFRTGQSFRTFLEALSDEQACDAMKWTWPQKNIGENHETLLMWGVDDNTLMNNGGKGNGTNTGCPKEMHCGMYDEYALRNISKGEELLCNYNKGRLLCNYNKFYPTYPSSRWRSFGL